MNDAEFNHHIGKAHLAAAGWRIQVSGDANPFSCHMFYLIDFRRDACHIVALPMDALNALKSNVPVSDAVAGVDHFLGLVVADPADMEASNFLGSALATYIKHTQTYRVWAEQAGVDERGHFCINLYGNFPSVTLRPFVLRSLDGELFIHRDRVMRHATEVLDHDRRVSPYMF